jgi:hypothetical protein
MSLATVDRAEPLVDSLLARLAAISQRDHDEVALVALYILEVLDEERLAQSFAPLKIEFHLRIARGKSLEFAADEFALFRIDRDDADCAELLGVSIDQLLDRPIDSSTMRCASAGF